MKRLLLSGTIVLLLSSCATSINTMPCVHTGEIVAGFWWGLWNGITMGFSFLGSLFDNSIALYDVNNNGAWYNLGFVLGTGSLITTIKAILSTILKND